MEEMLKTAIVLAAGKSTRIKSEKSKLLHEILGRPVICHLLDTLTKLELSKILLVLGHQKDQIISKIKKEGFYRPENFEFIEQKEQLGTGHAVKCALSFVPETGNTVILAGDVPLLKKETLFELLESLKDPYLISILTSISDDPTSYGRVIKRDGLISIVEEKDASPEEKKEREINSGIYVVKNKFLKKAINSLKNDNSQNEYYLTDIVKVAAFDGINSVKTVVANLDEVLGMNDRIDLYKVSKIKRLNINEKWMRKGVTFLDPEGTIVEESVKLERDVVIYPGCVLTGVTEVGEKTIISSGVHLHDTIIGSNVHIKPYCVIESSQVKEGVVIGPFAHLRPNSKIGEKAKIGNFVEIKKSNLGKGSKVSHLTYIGDAEIGDNVNIGCGVITCNYDGKRKHKTIIEDDVFIGSDNQLIAPVTVGKGAYTASGSTITKDVPPGALAISRTRQENKIGYVEKMNKQKDK